jgi:hypothetical protein
MMRVLTQARLAGKSAANQALQRRRFEQHPPLSLRANILAQIAAGESSRLATLKARKGGRAEEDIAHRPSNDPQNMKNSGAPTGPAFLCGRVGLRTSVAED